MTALSNSSPFKPSAHNSTTLALELLDAVSDDHRNPGVEAWCKEFNTLKARRIQQNAAFAATVFYFPLGSRDLIRKVWNDQLLPAQKLELLVGNLLNKFTESPQQQKRPERSKNETACNWICVLLRSILPMSMF